MLTPKFKQALREEIAGSSNESARPRYGIIVSYDINLNTATVVLSAPDSDQVERILDHVVCPVYPGVQMLNPQPGQGCWVVWAGGKNDSRPMITHFFDWNYGSKNDNTRLAAHTIPQYLLSM